MHDLRAALVMVLSTETVSVLKATLPSTLHADLEVALARIPLWGWNNYERVRGEPVNIEGEQVRLLNRFYPPEPRAADLADLTERQRQVMACLYGWHHDGYVRERWMAGIRGDEPWLPLFMLRLVGDYIEPIWERALADIDAIPRKRYEDFAKDNPAFLSATRDRIVAYHRYVGRFRRDFLDNPAYRFMSELGLWEGPQARRWIALGTRLARKRA